MARHSYICTVPQVGCTKYVAGNVYEFSTTEPPPDPYILGGTTVCAGTKFMLDNASARSAQKASAQPPANTEP